MVSVICLAEMRQTQRRMPDICAKPLARADVKWGPCLKYLLIIVLLMFPVSAKAEWIEYVTMGNGDVHFFDNSRIEKKGNILKVWSRIRYNSSVMGASSYQNLMEIDCSERTLQILQNTFYTDKRWKSPAMATDTAARPKMNIKGKSGIDRLADILCK